MSSLINHMNTSEFLNSILAEMPAIDLEAFPKDISGYAEESFIKLPLLGELTGVETYIFNGFRNISKKLNSQLDLIAIELKKRYGCKRADIASEIVESLANNALYSKLVEGDIKVFSPKGFEELISAMEPNYDPDNLIYEDGGTELRVLAYSMAEDLVKVQGETIEEKVRSISYKLPFISDYTLETIDISELLKNYEGIYSQYQSFLFANSPNAILRVLLYTRLGIDHDVLTHLRISSINRLQKAAEEELKAPVVGKSNAAKAKKNVKKDEVSEEEETDKSVQLDDPGESQQQDFSVEKDSESRNDEGK